MEENLIKRVGDNVLNTVYVDGQVYLHTDVNELAKVCKTAINENYYDIQRLENGDTQAGDALLLNGASLSKAVDGQLVGSDDTVSTSLQVKNYVDLVAQGIELTPGPQGERGETGERGPQGDKGDTGNKGADGVGVPTGGSTGQILSKKSNSNYDTEWKNLDISSKADKTYVDTELGKKQNTLVNTENIKSINGTSLLGSGNITTPNTTYSEISSTEITAGTSSTERAISGRRSQEIVNKARSGLVGGNANANNIVNNIFVGTQAEYDALPVKTGILAIIKE